MCDVEGDGRIPDLGLHCIVCESGRGRRRGRGRDLLKLR